MRKTKGNRIFGIEIREILTVEYDMDLSPLFLHGPLVMNYYTLQQETLISVSASY